MSSDRTALEGLKRNWEADPCWDLEDTEGFEWARDELLQHRILKEAEWRAEHDQREREHALRQQAFGRVPVGVAGGVLPVVVCRDGSVWELTNRPFDGPNGQRENVWRQLPPIPGSIADIDQKESK